MKDVKKLKQKYEKLGQEIAKLESKDIVPKKFVVYDYDDILLRNHVGDDNQFMFMNEAGQVKILNEYGDIDDDYNCVCKITDDRIYFQYWNEDGDCDVNWCYEDTWKYFQKTVPEEE